MKYASDPQAPSVTGLRLDDFKPDEPKTTPRLGSALPPMNGSDLIDGVKVTTIAAQTDPRGALLELLTTRSERIAPIVHVYQVVAKPGSIRAWIYHRYQYDRLAYTNGTLDVILYDIRPDSPTINTLNVFRVGEERPCLLEIPPFVIHGVHNPGTQSASFVNLPTAVYDPDIPDKYRLPWNDPRIPYSFDGR